MESYRTISVTVPVSIFKRLIAECNEGNLYSSPAYRRSIIINKLLVEHYAEARKLDPRCSSDGDGV